ncbi:MAG: TldD/PmbA family protein [Euryarchaeota archaeon]|nr:TldD/PmbA family protein [Euryarchaeota archaeon]
MISEIANETLDLANQFTEHVEVYVEKEETLNVDIQKNKVDFAKESFTYGVGIRVILEGKIGFSYTTNLQNLGEMVENAIFNAECNIKDKNFAFAPKSKYKTVKGIYDKRIESMEIVEAIEFAKTMIGTVHELKCQPTSGGFSTGCIKSFLINSEGTSCEDISTLFSGFISVIVEDGEDISTAHESDSSRYLDINPEWLAEEACRIASNSLNGKHVETKDMDVVLDYHAAAGLLGTFVHALNADNVQRGRSVFADKIGEEVVSPSLSIYDDGTIKKGLNSSTCDGEGTPSQRTTVMDSGVLKNFLYDIYTSNKGGVESTGNGIRSSFADTPSVGLSNFILDFDEIYEISDIGDGVLVSDVLGAHTSNPISGDFSVEASNTFKIEQEEVVYPIKKAMLSGNIFQALQNASAISKKTRQIGSFITPRILVRDMRVVG